MIINISEATLEAADRVIQLPATGPIRGQDGRLLWQAGASVVSRFYAAASPTFQPSGLGT